MDKMAARLAAMLETANGRNLIERIEVLMPRPFDLRTTATIPQVGLQMLSVRLCHQSRSGVLLAEYEIAPSTGACLVYGAISICRCSHHMQLWPSQEPVTCMHRSLEAAHQSV